MALKGNRNLTFGAILALVVFAISVTFPVHAAISTVVYSDVTFNLSTTGNDNWTQSDGTEYVYFNISNSKETKILDLAKKIYVLCNEKESRPFKFKSVAGFKYDVKRRIPDVRKAKRVLGWKAEIKLEDGLNEVVDWLKIAYRKQKR